MMSHFKIAKSKVCCLDKKTVFLCPRRQCHSNPLPQHCSSPFGEDEAARRDNNLRDSCDLARVSGADWANQQSDLS